MTRRLNYHHRVRFQGRVASIDAMQSGIARVQFADSTTRLVPKSQLHRALNNVDRIEKPRVPRSTPPTPRPTVVEEETIPTSSVLARVCQQLGLDPTAARRKLRKKGLSAPYDNETAILAALI